MKGTHTRTKDQLGGQPGFQREQHSIQKPREQEGSARPKQKGLDADTTCAQRPSAAA